MTEPKRELTSVDIAAVVGELRKYVGAKFDKFYQYGDDTVRVRLRHYDHGRAELFAEVGETKRMHLVDDPPDAPQRPPNLPMLMRKRLSSGELTAVEQHGFDRVVVLRGERGDEYSIVVELFGDGNFVFAEGDVYAADGDEDVHERDDDEIVDGRVLRPLRTVRLKSRTVAGGETYEFPPERTNPRELDHTRFAEVLEDSGTDLVRTLASVLGFGGLYAEELCARAGVEKETAVEDATDDDLRGVYDAMTDLFERLDSGKLEPRIVYEGAEGGGDDDELAPIDVTPFALARYEEDDYESEGYETFNAALDAYFDAVEEYDEKREEREGDDPVEKQRRIVEHQERGIEEFEEEEQELRDAAESLYENYGVVNELVSAVRGARDDGASWDEVRDTLEEARERGMEAAELVERIDEQNDEVVARIDGYEVSLDPRDGVESNASALYEEAKEVAEKREGAREALEESRAELERLLAEEDKEGNEEDESGGTTLSERDDPWYERFRWFRTSDGFLVIGGRDADQNDEIYNKYLEPDDLVFHTQARGGPVTVLKRAEPDESARDIEIPEQSREEAARFAGAYSSVWDSGTHAAEVYEADAEQVSKTPESGEYIDKGSVVVRGDREYRTVPMRVSVGLRLDDEAGIFAGPPSAVETYTDFAVELEPGRYTREDIAKKVYRRLRDEHGDLARRLTGVDEVARYIPSGSSRIVD